MLSRSYRRLKEDLARPPPHSASGRRDKAWRVHARRKEMWSDLRFHSMLFRAEDLLDSIEPSFEEAEALLEGRVTP